MVVQNSEWNGAHGFCGIEKDILGQITKTKFTQTGAASIIVGEGSTSAVQTGFFQIANNTFINTTADYPLLTLNGTWFWDNIERNVFKFTGSANSKAININCNQVITNHYAPIKHQSFIIPSNVGPVSADGQSIQGTHCYIPTNVSEVGNHGATTENQVWAHTNGTNRSVTMLGGNLGGEMKMEVLRFGAQFQNATVGGTAEIIVENDKTYYVGVDGSGVNETVYLQSREIMMAGLNSDQLTVSWSERNTDHPVNAQVKYVSASGSIGFGGTITNGGRI